MMIQMSIKLDDKHMADLKMATKGNYYKVKYATSDRHNKVFMMEFDLQKVGEPSIEEVIALALTNVVEIKKQPQEE